MVDSVILSTWCELRDKKSEAFLVQVCLYISRIGSKALQSKILGTKASDEETWKSICYIQMSHIVQRWEALQGVRFSFKLAGGASYNWEQMGKRKEKHPYHPPYRHSSGNMVWFFTCYSRTWVSICVVHCLITSCFYRSSLFQEKWEPANALCKAHKRGCSGSEL